MKQILFLKGILIVSFLSVIVYPIYLFVFLYPSFQNMIIKEKESDAKEIVSYIVQEADIRTSVQNKWAEYLTLDQMDQLKAFIENFNLIKMRVFSDQGLIVYSTLEDEIDQTNNKEYFKNIVKKGNIFSKYVKKGKASADGNHIGNDVVEIYVPIMKGEIFEGAIEVYYDITPQVTEYNTLFKISNIIISIIAIILIFVIILTFKKACENIKDKKRVEEKLNIQKIELNNAIEEIHSLQDIIPICSYCKKVRDDKGFWEQVGDYINKHSNVSVSHGICPDCVKKHFPDLKKVHRKMGID